MGYPKKPVVLVVDDTIANIRILDDLLRGEYTVRVATNGATALRLALSEQHRRRFHHRDGERGTRGQGA